MTWITKAIASCLATGSDYVLVPEFPNDETWKDKMCKSVKKGRDRGKRMSVILIAEGARDTKGNHITADEVKTVIEEELKMEARVTILGHIQRGGTPCFYDRLLVCVAHASVGYFYVTQMVLRAHKWE